MTQNFHWQFATGRGLDNITQKEENCSTSSRNPSPATNSSRNASFAHVHVYHSFNYMNRNQFSEIRNTLFISPFTSECQKELDRTQSYNFSTVRRTSSRNGFLSDET